MHVDVIINVCIYVALEWHAAIIVTAQRLGYLVELQIMMPNL